MLSKGKGAILRAFYFLFMCVLVDKADLSNGKNIIPVSVFKDMQ